MSFPTSVDVAIGGAALASQYNKLRADLFHGLRYGTSATGSVTWAADTNLNPATLFQYSDATLNVTKILSVTAVNDPLIIHTTGNVTINGIIDLNGKGGAGGPKGVATGGSTGTAGASKISGWTNAGGAGSNYSGSRPESSGAGGGSSSFSAGDNGQNSNNNDATAGLGGALISGNKYAALVALGFGVVCGSGGGGGGQIPATTGYDGGAGGGALCWTIGGNLTLGSSSIIRADGATGATGSSSGTGGSGGGGGGDVLIIVQGSITNNGVTLTAAGGAYGGPNIHGGLGATGKIRIISLDTGTVLVS